MRDRALSVRSVAAGLLGMALITSSSMFMALKMGTMPWPILFATILSMLVIGKTRTGTIQEVNVTQTIMASGAMVAAGLVFTVPALWIADPNANVPLLPVLAMMFAGVLLGLCFSFVYRHRLIEVEDLVFPHGNAAAETMQTGISSGPDGMKLWSSLGFSSVFAALRDGFGIIPSRFYFYKGGSLVQPVSLWLSPMALSIGAMISAVSAIVWFCGALFAYLVFQPVSMKMGLFSSMALCDEFRKNIGIGIVIGTGVGVFLKAVAGKLLGLTAHSKGKGVEDKVEDRKAGSAEGAPGLGRVQLAGIAAAVVVSTLVLVFLTPLGLPEAVLAVCGAALTTLLSGMLTGQSGMNPLEVFGILTMLLSSLLFHGSRFNLVLTAGTVSVACGLTGVMMNDFRSGKRLGTDPGTQLKAEAIGAFAAAVLSTLMIYVIKRSIGTFGTDQYPAPQAVAIMSLTSDGGNNMSLLWGIAIGCILFLLKVPSATLGLGFYLPVHISLSMGIGALASLVLKKTGVLRSRDVNLVSSGFMGGEGVVGIVIAIISIFR